MAVTVTANLTDITLGETTDDDWWSGDVGEDSQAEIFRQGAGAVGWIVNKNGDETGSYDIFTSNGSAVMDMSGTDVHLFITLRCDIAPFIDYVHIGLQSDTAHGSGTSGTDYWTVVDNTVDIEWAGEWLTIKLDINSSTKFSTSGTLDLSAITDFHINVDNSNSGNIRSIENTYIDSIRFGTGIKITGTDWDWQDVADEDNLVANKWDIVKKVGPGVFEVNGQLQIGDGATSTTCNSANETLFFKDVSTMGIEGGPIGKQAAGFFKILVTGSGVTAFDPSNLSVLASANAPFIFDADDSGLPTGSIDWDGGTIIQCSSFLSDGEQDFINISFFDCGQIEPAGSDFTNFLIDNYTGTDGAILWPGGTTVKNGTIQNSDRAIEITQASNQDFQNLLFPNNTYDVHLNNGGTDIDVSKTGTSNPTNYVATGGGAVTFVGASVDIDVHCGTADDTDVQYVRVYLQASSGAGPFPWEEEVTGISNSGDQATVTHAAHGMASADKVKITGASLAANNGVFAIVWISATQYSYTMLSTPGSSPTGTILSTFVALTGETDVDGDIGTSRVYPSGQPVEGWARKTSASPLYKTAPLVGTISDTTGFSAVGIMIPDE